MITEAQVLTIATPYTLPSETAMFETILATFEIVVSTALIIVGGLALIKVYCSLFKRE